MAKTKRRSSSRRSNRRRSYRTASRNPLFGRARHRSHRRRRNPGKSFGLGLQGIGGWVLWGTAGAVATRALPATLFSQYNSGIAGYGLNAASMLAASLVASQVGGKDARNKVLAGGAIAIGLRIFSDAFSSKASAFGLSGDLDFDLGYYIPNQFPLPTTGTGPFLLQPGQSGNPMVSGGNPGISPVAAIQAPGATTVQTAPMNAADEPQRWGTRWAA